MSLLRLVIFCNYEALIELIEVDVNFYFNGENKATFMGEDEEIMYRLLLKYKADTSVLTFDIANEFFNNCYSLVSESFMNNKIIRIN